MSDLTDMIPEVHERKWEIDSYATLCVLPTNTGR